MNIDDEIRLRVLELDERRRNAPLPKGAAVIGLLFFAGIAALCALEANGYGGDVAMYAGGYAGLVAVLILLACVYFVPSVIASNRKHRNTTAIFLVNALFGLTLIGWCVALIWATTDNVRKD
jgi:hypothetical protein